MSKLPSPSDLIDIGLSPVKEAGQAIGLIPDIPEAPDISLAIPEEIKEPEPTPLPETDTGNELQRRRRLADLTKKLGQGGRQSTIFSGVGLGG